MQYNSLAFVASFKRATDEGSLPEIAQYSPYSLPLNVLLLPKDQTVIFYLLKDVRQGFRLTLFGRNDNGSEKVPMFVDLKLHNVGPNETAKESPGRIYMSVFFDRSLVHPVYR